MSAVKKPDFSPTLVKGILALLLRDEDFCDRFFPVLKPEHFLSDDKLLYQIAKAIWELYDKYGKFPSEDILIEEVFKQKGVNIGLYFKPPTVEEEEALMDAYESLYEYNIADDKKYIEDNVTRILSHMAIVKVLQEMRGSITSIDFDVDGFAQQIQEATTFAQAPVLGKNLFDDLDARTEDRITHVVPLGAVTLSIPSLNEFIEDGGIVPGSLCYWLAPTNGGKTCALIYSAYTAAMVDKLNVVYVSAELTEEMIKQRMDSCITKIRISDVRREAAKVKALYLGSKSYQEAAKRIRVVEVPIGSTSVADIDNIITRLEKKQNFKANVIVVDYADNLKAAKKTDAYRHEVASIYKDLKELARNRKIVVWTASQMNDQGTEASEKEGGAISTRHSNESRAKAHVTDIIIGIARTQKEKDMGIARLVLVKNRLGGGDGHTVRIFPDFARSLIFTGKSEELGKTSVDEPIEGLDKNIVEKDDIDIYGSTVE